MHFALVIALDIALVIALDIALRIFHCIFHWVFALYTSVMLCALCALHKWDTVMVLGTGTGNETPVFGSEIVVWVSSALRT